MFGYFASIMPWYLVLAGLAFHVFLHFCLSLLLCLNVNVQIFSLARRV